MVARQVEQRSSTNTTPAAAPSAADTASLLPYLLPAIHGFFRSIALAPDQSLQDTLRLLTLWFQHGAIKEVEAALAEGFNTVSMETWLQV